MPPRTKKAAEAPAPAPAVETPVEPTVEPEAPAAEPTIDDVINADEPLVELVQDEEPAEPEQPAAPATSQLEPPAAPEANPNGLNVPRAPEGGNVQVTDKTVNTAGWDGPRREYIDAATRQRVDLEAAFDKRQKFGGAYICHVRILERLWFPDRNEPESRLVVAQGKPLNAAAVDHLIEHITAAHAEFPA